MTPLADGGSAGWGPRDWGAIISASAAAIALFLNAFAIRRNARNTMIATFNDIRHRLEQIGQDLEQLRPGDTKYITLEKALFNELEWLAHLVRHEDIAIELFAPSYATAFLHYCEQHRPVIDGARKRIPAVYDDILWLEQHLQPWRHADNDVK